MNFGAFLQSFGDRYYRGLSLLDVLQRFRWVVCPFDTIGKAVGGGANSLLDVGCGAGLFVGAACKSGLVKSATGLDSSSAAIARGIKMAEAADLRDHVDLRQVCSTSEWPQATFDMVTCFDVLHHVSPLDRGDFLDEVCKRVGTNGLLVVKDMASRPRVFAFANILHDLIFARQLITPVDQVGLTTALEARGFVIDFQQIDRKLWYLHYTIVARLR